MQFNLKDIEVSVPLRGKYCREYFDYDYTFGDNLEFPSPCGVNIVGNLTNVAVI